MRPGFLVLILGVALALLAAAGPAHAVPFSTRVDDVSAAAFPQVALSVSVFTREALPPPSRDWFTLSEDSTPVTSFEVALDPRPVYVALVLDRSGSMAPAMPEMKRAAYTMVRLLRGRALVGLTTFADDISEPTAFTDSPDDLKPAIARMEPFGATALYDACARAVRAVGFYPESDRRVVVAFTDGVDQNAERTARQSALTAKDLVARAREKGVALYFIGLGPEVDRELLTKMARLTGGAALHAPTKDGLAGIFQDVARMVSTAWRLTYASPRPEPDDTWRNVVITSRVSGHEDQGTGRYRARPARPAEPAALLSPSSSPSSPSTYASITTTYTPLALDSRLLRRIQIEPPGEHGGDPELLEAHTVIVTETNALLGLIVDEANAILGPLFVEWDEKVEAREMEDLAPLATKGRAVIYEARDRLLAEIAGYSERATALHAHLEHGHRRTLAMSAIRAITTLRASAVRADCILLAGALTANATLNRGAKTATETINRSSRRVADHLDRRSPRD